MKLATLCYLEKDGQTLMLHRIKKQSDIHQGKWNGLGGKFQDGETPEECVIREVREESGLTIRQPRLRGFITFPKFKDQEDWYVFVFTATEFEGELIDSDEGRLAWIENSDILQLPLWEGDRIFLPHLKDPAFFSGKFVYEDGKLQSHHLLSYT
jgi:8-oxo-dGTP diphosphatase